MCEYADRERIFQTCVSPFPLKKGSLLTSILIEVSDQTIFPKLRIEMHYIFREKPNTES